MFGKIENNKLVIAGTIIKTSTGWISNPTETDLRENGYKEIEYGTKPTYDTEEYKLVENYSQTDTTINVSYSQVALTTEEHNAVIQSEIVEEENKLTARNYRMAIKGDTYAISKIDEIENNIATLRNKLR